MRDHIIFLWMAGPAGRLDIISWGVLKNVFYFKKVCRLLFLELRARWCSLQQSNCMVLICNCISGECRGSAPRWHGRWRQLTSGHRASPVRTGWLTSSLQPGALCSIENTALYTCYHNQRANKYYRTLASPTTRDGAWCGYWWHLPVKRNNATLELLSFKTTLNNN